MYLFSTLAPCWLPEWVELWAESFCQSPAVRPFCFQSPLTHLTHLHHLPWIILGEPGSCPFSAQDQRSSLPFPCPWQEFLANHPSVFSHSARGPALKGERLPRTNLNNQKEEPRWEVFQKINYLTNKCRIKWTSKTWC